MKYLSPREVTLYKDFPFDSHNTVRKMVKNGEFGKVIKLGKNNRYLISEGELAEWIKALRK